MQTTIKTLLLSFFVCLSAFAYENKLMAETSAGKVITIETSTIGTLGGFHWAQITITDGNRIIYSERIEQADKYVDEEIGAEKALIILEAYTRRSTLLLRFNGTYYTPPNNPRNYLTTLRNKKRKKLRNCELVLKIIGGLEYKFTDLILFRQGGDV